MALWVITPSLEAAAEADLLRHHAVCLGLQELPDLSHATPAELKKAVRAAYPDETPERISIFYERALAFLDQIIKEDIVALYLKHQGKITFGRVTSGYLYQQEGLELKHLRRAVWVGEPVALTEMDAKYQQYFGGVNQVQLIHEKTVEEAILRRYRLGPSRHWVLKWAMPGLLLFNLILLVIRNLQS